MTPDEQKRQCTIERETAETSVRVALDLQGRGRADVDTGIGFLDHMLTLLAGHGLFDLEVRAEGDLHVDGHHTAEDVGIVLGQAVAKCLGNKAGIRRYGHALLPMDEALAQVALDCSGRGLLVFDAAFGRDKIGDFDVELTEEFFRALAHNAGITLHVRVLDGRNAHHIVEAIFKAVGRALRGAVEADPRREGVPSTKGTLT
jgi:imidazoleglycerol-phosphate dehydratase